MAAGKTCRFRKASGAALRSFSEVEQVRRRLVEQSVQQRDSPQSKRPQWRGLCRSRRAVGAWRPEGNRRRHADATNLGGPRSEKLIDPRLLRPGAEAICRDIEKSSGQVVRGGVLTRRGEGTKRVLTVDGLVDRLIVFQSTKKKNRIQIGEFRRVPPWRTRFRGLSNRIPGLGPSSTPPRPPRRTLRRLRAFVPSR